MGRIWKRAALVTALLIASWEPGPRRRRRHRRASSTTAATTSPARSCAGASSTRDWTSSGGCVGTAVRLNAYDWSTDHWPDTDCLYIPNNCVGRFVGLTQQPPLPPECGAEHRCVDRAPQVSTAA